MSDKSPEESPDEKMRKLEAYNRTLENRLAKSTRRSPNSVSSTEVSGVVNGAAAYKPHEDIGRKENAALRESIKKYNLKAANKGKK